VKERERLLDPVERVSEFLFGLFMALTFVGAVSVATDGKAEIRTMFLAAFGCNIAWGLVDGVMYVVQGVAARWRAHTLALAGRAAPSSPRPPLVQREELLGGIAIFLACVVSTLPVVLPFAIFSDLGTAKNVSRGVALALLYLGGHIIGRHAGFGGWKAGLVMVVMGTLLVAAIMALGG
jgi:hypothetical protein